MASRGCSPRLLEKFVKKTTEEIDNVFKILVESFYNNLRNFISSEHLSRDYYWKSGIQEIQIFPGFKISQRSLDIS